LYGIVRVFFHCTVSLQVKSALWACKTNLITKWDVSGRQ
jgi:hypothetical protein